MSFNKTLGAGKSHGDTLEPAEINQMDGYISYAVDNRAGQTNTIASINTFSDTNLFYGDMYIYSYLRAYGTNILSGTTYLNGYPSATSPISRTVFLGPNKFNYWYTSGLTTGSTYILNAGTAAKQSVICKPETTLDAEQASIGLPTVPYFKVYYYNNANVQSKNHMYNINLDCVPDGATITNITLHYQPYGYASNPTISAERLVLALYKTAEIASITDWTTAMTTISSLVETNATYTLYQKNNQSFGTLSEVKSNLRSYMLNINTGTYSGTATVCSHLFFGASVTYTHELIGKI